jgi:hypothetical protein
MRRHESLLVASIGFVKTFNHRGTDMASGKTTGVHYWLIAFVMLTLISSVTAFMMYRHANEIQVELDTATADLRNQGTAATNARADSDALQTLLLPNAMETVGRAGGPPTTTIGFVIQEMSRLAGPSAQPTVVGTLAKMREQLDNMQRELDEAKRSNAKWIADFQALEEKYKKISDEHDSSRVAAEDQRDSFRQEKEETVASLQKELESEKQKNVNLQIEFEKYREDKTAQIDDLNNQISKLTETNQFLTREINNMRESSFDIPDGKIVNVDYDSKRVWVNIGRDDNLRPGTTFSVYEQGLSTVGGRVEDIKASIQIISVDQTLPHQSVAIITSEGRYPGDYERPILKGDSIFSPLWRSGIQEVFAFAGNFDIDGDGLDDSALLKEMVRNAGGDVLAHATPEGEREGEEITSRFKFFVEGNIGNPAKTPDPIEQDKIKKLHAHVNEMKKEAVQSGVRVITMNDFLSYMGYRPQRRLWRPGERLDWNLKGGLPSTRERRESRGTVSGSYSNGTTAKPPVSRGGY